MLILFLDALRFNKKEWGFSLPRGHAHYALYTINLFYGCEFVYFL